MNNIIIRNGDIFSTKCEAIVNPVNCVGVMGKGLALQFKNKFPNMYKDYVEKCRNNQVKIGTLYVFKENGVKIINFPTKMHWKNKSELGYIRQGLLYLKYRYKEMGIKSIAIPKIGCGCGGLNWEMVKKEIIGILGITNLTIEIFE